MGEERHSSGTTSAAVRTEVHPAFHRFQRIHGSGPRLLFITAAPGTGRRLFARSWLDGAPGEIHDLSDGSPETSSGIFDQLQQLTERLDADPQLRLAVLLPVGRSTWLLAARYHCSVARHRDLLLSAAELAQALDCEAHLAEAIRDQTGGWLGACRALAGQPESRAAAYQLINAALLRWLRHHPYAVGLRQAAFLPEIEESVLEVFFTNIAQGDVGLEDLVDSGLVQGEGQGGWMMPSLIRRALMEQQRLMSPAAATSLERAGLEAVAVAQSVQKAAETALRNRRWGALSALLMDRWVDLFVSNPAALRSMLSKMPGVLTDQAHYLWVGARIVAAVGTDRMVLPFPTVAPDPERDQSAQRLQMQTARLYQRPTARALSVGTLQITYLRLTGMYQHSAEAALRLRSAIRAAFNARRTSRKLISISELHAGISLQLQGLDVEAKWAYQAALNAGLESGKAFHICDASGRLALLCAMQGDFAAAGHWASLHAEQLQQVGWGKPMVARGVILARAWQAMLEVDLPELRSQLRQLPDEPDSDEFWAVHALLLSFHLVFTQQTGGAASLLERLNAERVHARALLSRELLAVASQLVALARSSGCGAGSPRAKAAAEFRALGCLRTNRPDEALALLELAADKPPSQQWPQLAGLLELAARNPEEPGAEDLERVRQLSAEGAALLPLALLATAPGWGAIPRLLSLDEAQARRLELIGRTLPALQPRPVLTERELELLQLLRTGLSRRQMAEVTFRSPNTIKTQLRGLYKKLGATDAAAALDRARKAGL